jgi:amidohydrolase
MYTLDEAQMIASEIIDWRQAIHKNPELSFKEQETAEYIGRILSEKKITWHMLGDKAGIVATVGRGHPAIGIRADMDALPIQEATDLEYISQRMGVMHACGHDAHMAMAIGAALILQKYPHRPAGEVRILFQQAEEHGDEEWLTGARHMIAAGAVNNLDALIGVHVFPNIPSGKVGILPGPVLSSGDYFEVTIQGKGGHDSSVHETVDPIFITCQVINAIYGIRARRINPLRIATISIGTIHAGTSGNIIPQELQFSGTIRCFDPETRKKILEELERALGIARQLGGDYHLTLGTSVPALNNDLQIAASIRESVIALCGIEGLVDTERVLGVDDFAWYSQVVPSAMFFLGVKPSGDVYPLHHPKFQIDESALPIGAAFLAETALRLLKTLSER